MSTKAKPGMQTRWTSTCEEIKSGKTKVVYGWSKTSCPGISVIEARWENGIFPYGWLWYRHETGNVVSIMECFVPEYLRRCGLMTGMFKQISEWYPETRLIVTGRVTEFSLPWAKKQGFVFNREMDRWELFVTPPKKKKAPKP